MKQLPKIVKKMGTYLVLKPLIEFLDGLFGP